MTEPLLSTAPGGVYVFVGVFRCLVSEVRVFRTPAEAEKAYSDFCGVSYSEVENRQPPVHPDYEDSGIYQTGLE